MCQEGSISPEILQEIEMEKLFMEDTDTEYMPDLEEKE